MNFLDKSFVRRTAYHSLLWQNKKATNDFFQDHIRSYIVLALALPMILPLSVFYSQYQA